MNEWLLINGILLFTFTLLFLSFTFSQELSRKNTFYGIYLEENIKANPHLKKLSKRFKLQSLFVFLLTSLPVLFYINWTQDIHNPLAILLPMVAQIVLYFAVYVHTYHQVKSYKDEHQLLHKGTYKTVIDTDFIRAKNSLKRIFVYLHTIPLAFALCFVIYAVYSYSSLPEQIPTHWNYLGEIDSWTVKSYASILFPAFMQLSIIILFTFVTIGIFSSRIKLNNNALEKSKSNALKYLKIMASGIYIMTLFITTLFGVITLYTMQAAPIPSLFMLVTLIGPLAGIILMFYGYYRYGDRNRSADKTNGSYTLEDDDRYWLWGFLYNNPEDPAVMVQKRYGLGWTINVGNRTGKLVMLIFILFIAAILILPLALS